MGTVFFEPSDATIVSDVSAMLAIVAAIVLLRWYHGLVAGAVVVFAAYAVETAMPALISGVPISWTAFEYGIIWAGLFLVYAHWLLIFGAAFVLKAMTLALLPLPPRGAD